MVFSVLEAHFKRLEHTIFRSPVRISSSVHLIKGSDTKGHIKGTIDYIDGSTLYFFEYVVFDGTIHRETYRYHWQANDGALIKRWDNAPHHPEVDSFPNHVHLADGSVDRSDPINLDDILDVVQNTIGTLP